MKRRDFSTGLLAAGLAAPPVLGPTSALATIKNDEKRELERFVRMQLLLTSQTILITWVLFMFPTILGLNFQRNIPRYFLQRAALGGLLLGLQRQPFGKRFESSVLLGNIVLWSSMLLILPLMAKPRRLGQVAVANGEFEFAHPGRPRPVSISGVPSAEQLNRQPVIGTARLNEKGEIGLVVPPLNVKFHF
jgi:hypothetical protein